MNPFDFQEPPLSRSRLLHYWLRDTWQEIRIHQTRQRRESRAVQIFAVAVIGFILAAILFPVFARPYSYSGPSCQSNLKSISRGTLQYAEDYDEHLPLARTWMDGTYPYVLNKRVYRCPDLMRVQQNCYGHAYNRSLDGKQTSKSSQNATVPLYYDSNLSGRNANAPGRAGLATPPRHATWNNMAFLDGHVQHVDVRGKIIPSQPQ